MKDLLFVGVCMVMCICMCCCFVLANMIFHSNFLTCMLLFLGAYMIKNVEHIGIKIESMIEKICK